MTYSRVGIGVIGCGVISGAYFETMNSFEILNVIACADQDTRRAQASAEQYHVPIACSVEELLANPAIEIIVNLTTPDAHMALGLAALQAKKSLYSEKPLAITRADALCLLEIAKLHGLLIGGAPDTFLGGALQTCRQMIDEGRIGQPIAATAFLANRGPECWHPNPEFYYQPGGGPMFDMGPYYLTALISLLGPVQRVAGLTKLTFPTRTITNQLQYGASIPVVTPTHVTGLLQFSSGVVGTLLTSFDIGAHTLPTLEIYGSHGSLSLSDPSFFAGPVLLRCPGDREWQDIPLTYGYSKHWRGIGVADMAYALRTGRPQRASGELVYHVLDIMHAFYDSSDEDKFVTLSSSCQQPLPLPLYLQEGILDS